jgi:hypothetical protein
MTGGVHHPVTSHYQIGKGLLPVPFVPNRAWPPDESMGNRRSLRIFLGLSCFSSRRDIFFHVLSDCYMDVALTGAIGSLSGLLSPLWKSG